MTLTSQAVLAELDSALPGKPDSWRSAVLRRIVDLFLAGAALYGDEQVALFDEVIVRLILKWTGCSLPTQRPASAGRQRASPGAWTCVRHSDVAVSGPILDQAERCRRRPDRDRRQGPGRPEPACENRRPGASQHRRHRCADQTRQQGDPAQIIDTRMRWCRKKASRG